MPSPSNAGISTFTTSSSTSISCVDPGMDSISSTIPLDLTSVLPKFEVTFGIYCLYKLTSRVTDDSLKCLVSDAGMWCSVINTKYHRINGVSLIYRER